MIAAQLDDARARFTAIGPGHHGDSTASQSLRRPAWRRHRRHHHLQLLVPDHRDPGAQGSLRVRGRPGAAVRVCRLGAAVSLSQWQALRMWAAMRPGSRNLGPTPVDLFDGQAIPQDGLMVADVAGCAV